ncbi:MAG: flagellar motor switch protein FliG, partial [Glaciecola sp.]
MADDQIEEEKPLYDVNKLDGVEKASILLLSLSEEDAAQILKFMEPKQVQVLGAAMAAMDDMTQDKITAVHTHFIDEIQNYSTIGFKSQDFVKRALISALGEDKAAHLLDQIMTGSGAKGL